MRIARPLALASYLFVTVMSSTQTLHVEVTPDEAMRTCKNTVMDRLPNVSCTHIVMESTGVYWKPVLNVLEDDPDYSPKILLANRQQVKAVTGHKTDPHDAKWLAHLLRHAMIRALLHWGMGSSSRSKHHLPNRIEGVAEMSGDDPELSFYDLVHQLNADEDAPVILLHDVV
jgi:hypothetical protein